MASQGMNGQHTYHPAVVRALRAALDEAGLDKPGTVLIAALSGGADSVAMLRALTACAPVLGLQIAAAHLDHGIRAAAADDAGFVKALCSRLHVELDLEAVDVPTAARRAHRSLEMQARAMRYAFFSQVAGARRAAAVLTAHTLGDQAETMLLNLCRGAGPSALGGIPPDTVINTVRVLRPLLRVSRRDVEQYLQDIGQTWREDATNRDTTYRRNAVRHRVLPLLNETLNPQTATALARAASILHDDNNLLDDLTASAYPRLASNSGTTGALLREPFRRLHTALRRRILARWLRGAGVPAARLRFEWLEQIDDLASRTDGGGCIRLCGGIEVRHEYDRLCCSTPLADTPPAATAETTLAIPGSTPLPAFDCTVDIEYAHGFCREPQARPGMLPAQVHLCRPAAADALFSMTVRQRHPGDRIIMLGMHGARKLQDIMTDAKIPAPRRHRIPVFCINGDIAWIPGCRPAAAFAVPSANAPSLRIRVS